MNELHENTLEVDLVKKLIEARRMIAIVGRDTKHCNRDVQYLAIIIRELNFIIRENIK